MLAALAAAAALLAACGTEQPGDGDAGVRVVATTTQAGDLARRVGEGRAAVDQILAPNSDPHGYEPRPSDAEAIAGAALVVRSGGEIDDWLAELIDAAGADAQVVELLAAADPNAGGETVDPHWWQDPRAARRAVLAIRDAFIEADPDGRATYERNAASYVARLGRLDAAVAACIDRIPAADRELVTTHDALGRYADRYGLELIGALIPSRSTQAQPSSKAIGELVEQIEALDVQAVFPESSVDPELERAVARETGATVGSALWADSLGPRGSSGATYIASIESNTEAIVSGLSGGAEDCRPGG